MSRRGASGSRPAAVQWTGKIAAALRVEARQSRKVTQVHQMQRHVMHASSASPGRGRAARRVTQHSGKASIAAFLSL